MSDKSIFVLRHGNTFDKGDVMLRVGRGTDLPLSVSGRLQAQELGKHFKQLGIKPDLILVSPLQRTQQTADGLIAAQPDLPAWQIDERLNELHYGPDEGVPEDKVVARLGEAALAAWDERAEVPEGWPIDPGALVMDWQLLLEDLRAETAETIVIITSNGTARFLLPLCDGERPEAIKLKTAGFGELSLPQDGRPVLRSWNLRAPKG